MALQPLRVVHVLPGLGHGGIERTVLSIMRELRGLSHTVVAQGPRRGLYPEFAALAEVILCPHDPHRTLSFFLRLRRVIQRADPDVVLAHVFGNHTLVSWAAFLAGAPSIHAVCTNDPIQICGSLWKARLLAHAARPFSRGEVAVSETIGNVLTGALRLPRKRVTVIANGCPAGEIAEAAAAWRRTAPLEPDRLPRLVMISRLYLPKDHATLLRAVAILREQGCPVELCLAGDGPLRPALEALATTLGIDDVTRFLGDRDDVPQLLASADLAVHATTSEGFPVALLEAMAAGTPIVASDVPACREALDGGRCGMLVPPGDPAALASAIRSLLDDRGRCERLAGAASERVRTRFAADRMAAGYRNLILS